MNLRGWLEVTKDRLSTVRLASRVPIERKIKGPKRKEQERGYYPMSFLRPIPTIEVTASGSAQLSRTSVAEFDEASPPNEEKTKRM
ncbi:hypothetical protein Acr_13g0012610 [Actinidia rufa]|uniref:Uncharacterized protein n=1 Tax=Actinidia rufa TaxID=165716 RepID=A0A7J0FMC1_9ERIC|nr:hypothetical protein Acr_13g0012610 [Actinidia rufa]